jgi:hypothetical protein
MSYFSREWSGEHYEGCDQFEEDDASAECQCPDLMVERAIAAADNHEEWEDG